MKKEAIAIFLIVLGVLVGGTSIAGAVDANDTLISNFTLEQVPPTAPSISDLVNGTPGYDNVVISWITNQTCSNRVFYGINISSGNGTWSNWDNGTSSPSTTLTPLYPNTTYEYQAWSYNSANNSLNDSEPVGSPFPNFTTLTPSVPSISGLNANNIKTTTATISWSVNQSTDNRVFYGKNINLTDGVWSSWSNDSSSPSIGLSSLSQKTLYYYQAYSYNTYNSSLFDVEPLSQPYESFTTTKSDLMTINEWFDKFLPTYSLMIILVLVLLATLVIGLLTRSENVTGEDLKSAAMVIIIVAVVLTVGIIIMQSLANL